MTTEPSSRRPRSPSVPFICLARALLRARTLYDGVAQALLTIEEVANVWGLAPKSSAALQTVAALLAYGLAETGKKGDSRQIAISDRGARLFANPPPRSRAGTAAPHRGGAQPETD